jgi:putative endonuclease
VPYVYMLRCHGGVFYTGWTVDLAARVAAHQAGKASRYTRAHLPVSLAYWEELPTESAARRREPQLKRLSHVAKERLCRETCARETREDGWGPVRDAPEETT